jgi:hypothetical protein
VAKDAHEKTKNVICVEMLNEGMKLKKMFFGCFQVENKVLSMHKIACLHLGMYKDLYIWLTSM